MLERPKRTKKRFTSWTSSTFGRVKPLTSFLLTNYKKGKSFWPRLRAILLGAFQPMQESYPSPRWRSNIVAELGIGAPGNRTVYKALPVEPNRRYFLIRGFALFHNISADIPTPLINSLPTITNYQSQYILAPL